MSHTSPTVHALPSLHASVVAANTHPLFAAQVSIVQGLPSSHVTFAPLMHEPSSQVSLAVHALPSLHPELAGANTQPLVGSQ